MKKLMVLPFLFLVSIPVFAQAKALFTGNLSETERSGAYVKFVGVDISLPAHSLLYIKERGYFNGGQRFQSPTFLQLSNRTYLLRVTDVETKERKDEKPFLSRGTIAGEFFAGIGGEFVGAMVGGLVGAMLFPVTRSPEGIRLDEYGPTFFFSDMTWPTFFCVISGATVGASIGVCWAGTSNNHAGSYWATLGGSLLFAGTYKLIEGYEGRYSFLGHVIVPVIGAMVGFNLTRWYKSPPASESALIHFRNGQMGLAVPTVHFRPNSFDGRNLIQNIGLVQVDF